MKPGEEMIKGKGRKKKKKNHSKGANRQKKPYNFFFT
jgi:hypothetical protein